MKTVFAFALFAAACLVATHAETSGFVASFGGTCTLSKDSTAYSCSATGRVAQSDESLAWVCDGHLTQTSSGVKVNEAGNLTFTHRSGLLAYDTTGEFPYVQVNSSLTLAGIVNQVDPSACTGDWAGTSGLFAYAEEWHTGGQNTPFSGNLVFMLYSDSSD